MAENHIAKKVDKKAKYFAQWGPKGFITTPDKIVPFWGLKTTHEVRKAYLDKSEKEPKNVVQRNALKVTFNTRYLKASGTDPKDQMHQWFDLIGKKHPMYVGGQQFGSPLLQLEDVKWSNFIYAPDGEIIGADAEIHLIEWYEGIEIDQGWFNPEPENQGGVSGDLFNSGASNEIIIWNFCRAHGYSAAATAGIMGNMWQESRLKPDTNEIGGFGGYGLCQWTFERKPKLQNWCKTNGYDYRTLEGQLNFMLWEHKNTPYYWNNLGENYKKLTDVWTATDRWLTYYEGCTVRKPAVNWPGRLEHAKIYYGKYGKYHQVPLPGQSAGGSASNGAMTAKQKAVVNAAYRTGSAGNNMCAKWVCNAIDNSGILKSARLSLASNYKQYCFSSNEKDLKPGMICVTPTTPYGGAGLYNAGHIGIYVGNGKVRHNELNVVKDSTLAYMRSTYYTSPWYFGWMNGVALDK